uniref:Fibroblast growth factor n=1 Tax=Knipowitschia caucasica TaxID=637954 RepID=A0AAV2JYZ5_KNICA
MSSTAVVKSLHDEDFCLQSPGVTVLLLRWVGPYVEKLLSLDCVAGWLRVLALRAGVVAIRGEKSQRYLCIKATGRVYTQESFSAECELRENMEENHYNTYSSQRYPGLYLGLSRHGEAKNATKVEPWRSAAHFLPLTEMRFCPPKG